MRGVRAGDLHLYRVSDGTSENSYRSALPLPARPPPAHRSPERPRFEAPGAKEFD